MEISLKKEYQNISREKLESIRSTYDGPKGDDVIIEKAGVKMHIVYIENQKKLEIELIKKPFIIPESLIWNTINNLIK